MQDIYVLVIAHLPFFVEKAHTSLSCFREGGDSQFPSEPLGSPALLPHLDMQQTEGSPRRSFL